MGSSSSTLALGQALRKLESDSIISLEDPCWDVIFSTPVTTVELQQVIPTNVVRRLRHYRTHNFTALLYKCIEPVFLVASYGRSPPSARRVQELESTLHIALTLLKYAMPVALEGGDVELDVDGRGRRSPLGARSSSEDTEFPRRNPFTATFTEAFFVSGLRCIANQPEATLPPLPYQKDSSKSLGLLLCKALVEACFIDGLTVNVPSGVACEVKPPYRRGVCPPLLWYPGVGSDEPLAKQPSGLIFGRGIHTTRKLLLQTLLVTLSRPMYAARPDTIDAVFLLSLVDVNEVPLLPTLTASMLNAIINYSPYGLLPYTSHMVSDEESVVMASAQVLCALLDYHKMWAPAGLAHGAGGCVAAPQSDVVDELQALVDGELPSHPGEDSACFSVGPDQPIPPEASADVELHVTPPVACVSGSVVAQPTVTAECSAPFIRPLLGNSAWRVLIEMSEEEADAIIASYVNVISLRTFSSQTYLPDSQRNPFIQDELMLLLWKLIDRVPPMSRRLARAPNCMSYVLPLLDYAFDARRSPALHAHLQVSLFILLRLVQQRPFCLACNQSLQGAVPFKLQRTPFSYSDVILLVMTEFLWSDDEHLQMLQNSCAVVIAGMAPFVVNISPDTSSRLVESFGRFAVRCMGYVGRQTEDFIIPRLPSPAAEAEDQDGEVLALLVEAIASLIQYQKTSSAHVLVALMANKEVVRRVVDVAAAHPQHRGPDPLLIGTLQAAVDALRLPFEDAMAKGQSLVDRCQQETLVGLLPVPHPIVTRRSDPTFVTDTWATLALWSSLYMYNVPGTFGDRRSIQLLHFA